MRINSSTPNTLLVLVTIFLFATGCGGNDDCDCDNCNSHIPIENREEKAPSNSGPYTDPNTQIVWSLEMGHWLSWEHANDYCENSEAYGFSDWSLPTIDQLRTLIKGCDNTKTGGSCKMSNNCTTVSCWEEELGENSPCNGCEGNEGPYYEDENGYNYYVPEEFENYYCILFWSSTQMTDTDDQFGKHYLYIQPHNAVIDYWWGEGYYDATCVTCVRSGD